MVKTIHDCFQIGKRVGVEVVMVHHARTQTRALPLVMLEFLPPLLFEVEVCAFLGALHRSRM
jgi:hypothetical protein